MTTTDVDLDDLGEHLATFTKEHHHVLEDDQSYYVYAKKPPKRRAAADGSSRLELLSQRLKDLNERNREFWSKKR